ncbi:DUF3810 domain-containing protein [uncultured Oscillibacter sp.]|uniref:DUF3810 domain-containing protein n=1 Tax=uncultured Oscillibacter sp. TaxID=876091 RepID=UPI002622B4A0|nr:DUF3810 domain-containing protein [uncultured Oscillibacter sp.]
MRTYFHKYRNLHIWLLADCILLLAFFSLRGQRWLMNAVAEGFTGPLRRGLGRLCYLVPFSVMEVVEALAVLLGIGYAVWSVIAVARAGGRRRERAYGLGLGALCAVLSVWAGFCLLWGVNYWTDGFQDRSGIYAQPVALEDLRAVTKYFADRTSETAGDVKRDEHGLFAVPREEILDNSVHAYDGLTEDFPFLAFDDPGVKPMAFSRLMSAMDFTGFYSSFTGESNVNVDSPACMLPSTIAHELAHQRGFASEQECNFLAVLASTTCSDPAYIYSGWLIGYVYLGNALYSQDPESYRAIREALPEEVRLDLAYNNAYWAQFQDTPVQKASSKVYDGLLKSYGDERGIQSYGMVVDLLVAYYRPLCGGE